MLLFTFFSSNRLVAPAEAPERKQSLLTFGSRFRYRFILCNFKCIPIKFIFLLLSDYIDQTEKCPEKLRADTVYQNKITFFFFQAVAHFTKLIRTTLLTPESQTSLKGKLVFKQLLLIFFYSFSSREISWGIIFAKLFKIFSLFQRRNSFW